MKRNTLGKMSDSELYKYAEFIGITPENYANRDLLIEAIEQRKNRTATISTLGVTLTIPIKRLHGAEFSELINKQNRTDSDVERAMCLLLGEAQYSKLKEACTDAGELDTEDLGFAIASILTNDSLKN